MDSICIYPPQAGLGGPASFTGRLAAAFGKRGIAVHHDPMAAGSAGMLVIGGSKRLDLLWRARRRGVHIIQRLNGMNWLHRKLNTGIKHYLRSEVNNWILASIRSKLADKIIYQSQFSQSWWQQVYGPIKAAETVIYNGVDLEAFSPVGTQNRPVNSLRLLVVEGHLTGGYDSGLDNAVELVTELGKDKGRRWELMVAGDVPPAVRARLETSHPGVWITWAGIVNRNQVPELDRSAHVLFSADLNAACPNSVVEALACGLPVLAYDTGALPEMVTGDAGRVVSYGSSHWNLKPPAPAPLAEAALQIALEQEKFRPGARARAESQFNIENIVQQYIEVLF